MKSALLLATLSLIISLPAHAYETETGAVVICDAQKQVERYVQLFDGNPQVAIRAVNTEESNPNACAVVDVSYVEGPDVGMARSSSHAFRIVPVVVVGVNTSRRHGSVKPVLFFTPIMMPRAPDSARHQEIDHELDRAAAFVAQSAA